MKGRAGAGEFVERREEGGRGGGESSRHRGERRSEEIEEGSTTSHQKRQPGSVSSVSLRCFSRKESKTHRRTDARAPGTQSNSGSPPVSPLPRAKMLDVLKMGKKKAKTGVSLQAQMKQRLNKQQKAATRLNLRDQARQLEKEGKDDDAGMKKLRFEVRALFGKIDEDRSGSITKKEFVKSLQEDDDVIDFVDKSKTLRPLIRQDDYESSFMKLDTDGGGSITLIEFFNCASMGEGAWGTAVKRCMRRDLP